MDIENNIRKECRVCLDSCEEGENKLLNICGCKGSVKYIHRDCVKRWIKERKGNITCELCKTKYDTKKIGINMKDENEFYCSYVFLTLLILIVLIVIYIIIYVMN